MGKSPKFAINVTIPSEVREFIEADITFSRIYILPVFYAKLSDFGRMQEGYHFNGITGENLTSNPDGIASPDSLPWYSLTTYETSRPVRFVHRADMDSLVANLSPGDNLLFTDLYPIVEELTAAGDEPFILKGRLPAFGFEPVENSNGGRGSPSMKSKGATCGAW